MRIDASEKVTGRAKYADDIKLEGMLYATPLHAKVASAKILNINIDKAFKVPGVIKILTAKDVIGNNWLGALVKDFYLFATDQVRFAGDVLALVVADTKENAFLGADAIDVELEELPGVFSPEDAMQPKSPLIHPQKGNNIVSEYHITKGNAEKALKNCPRMITAKFQTSFIEHSYLETESVVVNSKSDGSIEVFAGMQHPFSTRAIVAESLNLPLAKVRVIQTTSGGGFGGKDDTISYVSARAALASIFTNKPIKTTYTREQSFLESYKRHPFTMYWKLGASKRGKLEALDCKIIADAGAYCSMTPFVIWRPTVQCTGPYNIKNVKCKSYGVYTNNTYTGAMRGFGTPQHVFACESAMDMLADECKMDPYDFRKKNFYKTGDTIQTGEKLTDHNVTIDLVTKTCLDNFNWEEKFSNVTRGKIREDGLLYGVGFATSYRGVSLGAEGKDFSSAIVNIQKDGSVILQTGVAENGQGLQSAMVKILARDLGLNENRITFLNTDTSNVPDGGPTVASRGTIMGGNAILNATEKIKEQLLPIIEQCIGTSRKGYFFEQEIVTNLSNKKTISFDELITKSFNNRIYPYALGTFRGPDVSWNDIEGKGKAYFTYVYNTQACELTVDPRAGKINVINVTAVHDVGKIINEPQARGQVYGGVMMGLGFALMENAKHENGIQTNLGFAKYKIPRSIHVPEIDVQFLDSRDSSTKLGAKSLGEPTNELMGAAVANAIYHATGIRFYSLPITAEKIREEINA